MEEKLEIPAEHAEKIHKIGREIRARLDSQYDQWGCGLPYSTIMSPKGHEAKRMGLSVNDLSNFLLQEGYIKIMNALTGGRYVFSGNCDLQPGEMLNSVIEQEINKKIMKRKINERK